MTYVFSDNRKSSWDFWQVPLSFIWQKVFSIFSFFNFHGSFARIEQKHYGVTTVMSEYVGVHLFYFACVFSLYNLIFPHHLLCGLTHAVFKNCHVTFISLSFTRTPGKRGPPKNCVFEDV